MNSNKETTMEQAPTKVEPFKSGEKGFAIFWLLFGGFFFYQSLMLYNKYPGLNSCAALPLFVTGVIVICAIAILILDWRAESLSTGQNVATIVKQTFTTLLPIDVLVALVLMFIYCLSLYSGLGFYVATPAFLFVSMTFFMRKQYIIENNINKKALVAVLIKNIFWTALAIVFILLVFTFLFSVVLP